ncbi:phasin family protein [Variovorax sp. OV329]|uniref:phasin family protein n=1 Tax=Variovorax sp. OV329 TaxID=1882825 RepID=UPI0008E58ABE|nr:phasin family protein [Variovorax sp. OV329]SFN07360.1 poly(hydroxyalkanoate) granule-associated protein [Variovorax sp. OV329]
MATDKENDNPTDRIKDSAQQIWLAGLGAFAKMQEEGSKAFEALVKDGAGVQKKTQQAAGETMAQAQARMASFASDFNAKAAGGWGKLENIFEERVARALEKLGVPTAKDVAALEARIAALEAQLQQKATEAPRRASSGGASARKSATHKTTAAAESAAVVVKPSRRNAASSSSSSATTSSRKK